MLSDVTIAQYLLVAATAFAASVLGGVTGYGTGLLLPPILVPIIGPEAVVPVIGVSAIINNASRLAAFRAHLNREQALLISLVALPGCVLGAWGYTRLAGPSVSMLIGAVLIVLVPLRRMLMRVRGHMSRPGLVAAGAGYGVLVGGTTGSGIVLLSILLAGGLSGTAVITTDAAISIVVGLMKTFVFQAAGALPLSSWIMALLIGVAATPGAFVARRFLGRISGDAHVLILDGVVVLGGMLLILQGLGAV